ncbi:DUF4386 domain-containing protein [Chitinophaga varians]|uniref:DUF4386 domain-containing protein n=1 Tax=Chitinophaga varians TaxID=2202339 RepID=UPI00165F6D57|nr:DUF4386 domain-containing protein [Chitinophaga varians]MBC9915303.1 DUF4386 domain-containing protein [Chitinophaga varians]
MDLMLRKERLAGFLFLVGILSGIFSVSPAIDSARYLTEAAANNNRVILSAIFQFIMSLSYVGIGILLYPVIKNFGSSLSIGFLSLRIIAATLVIVGIILLLSVLVVSKTFRENEAQAAFHYAAMGEVLKVTRDYINHVFMILVLCAGNIMFYTLLLKAKLVPQWLSVWGLVGNLLSALASIFSLFQLLDIITTEYLAMNAPTALQEMILGGWLMMKGFEKRPVAVPT